MDLTVVSLTDAGDYRWHAFFGSSGTDNGESAAFDPEGNLFIVGGSKSTWRVYPQVPPLHEHSTGDFDLVLVKVDLTAEIYLPLVMR